MKKKINITEIHYYYIIQKINTRKSAFDTLLLSGIKVYKYQLKRDKLTQGTIAI